MPSTLLLLLGHMILLVILLVVLLSEATADAWSITILCHQLEILGWNRAWMLDGLLVATAAQVMLMVIHLLLLRLWSTCMGHSRWARLILRTVSMISTILVRSASATCTHIWYMLVAIRHLIGTCTMVCFVSGRTMALGVLALVWNLADVWEILVLLPTFAHLTTVCPFLLTCSVGQCLTVMGLSTCLLRWWIVFLSSYESTVANWARLVDRLRLFMKALRTISFLHLCQSLVMVVAFEQFLNTWSF